MKNDINATIIKYNHDGDTVRSKKAEMRLCFAENPLIFEIMVKAGKNTDTAVSIPYDEVRDFILEREGRYTWS